MTAGGHEEVRRRLVHARLLGERFVYRLPGRFPEAAAGPDSSEEPPTVERPTSGRSSCEAFDAEAWEALRQEVMTCTRCELHLTRTQGVFGSGTPLSGFMVVGEAPGFHEDQKGEAFVGAAGQLLTKILAAIGFSRDEVFITNILKSRPPGNADPAPHQVSACIPYLERQIELIGPAVILTLGRHAARTLLGVDGSMASLRGRVFEYRGVPVVATYHPAALLRNPKLKRPTWEDVQLARRVHDEGAAVMGSPGSATDG
ncbi:MAG: uracil-DNA glycosylase [Gemmatimonadota bacterium]